MFNFGIIVDFIRRMNKNNKLTLRKVLMKVNRKKRDFNYEQEGIHNNVSSSTKEMNKGSYY